MEGAVEHSARGFISFRDAVDTAYAPYAVDFPLRSVRVEDNFDTDSMSALEPIFIFRGKRVVMAVGDESIVDIEENAALAFGGEFFYGDIGKRRISIIGFEKFHSLLSSPFWFQATKARIFRRSLLLS